jgi:hypothetical protein
VSGDVDLFRGGHVAGELPRAPVWYGLGELPLLSIGDPAHDPAESGEAVGDLA